MPVQPIRFGDEGQIATRELLRRFEVSLRPALAQPLGERLGRYFRTLEGLDREHGGHGPVAVEDAPELVAAILSDLGSAAGDAPPHQQAALADVTIGVALWAIRHDVRIDVPEPVVNALAMRANAARSREALAAVFGLMQGVIAHVAPALAADLERSNPERPWRILHANLAITAIRTEDAAMMDFAFDALERALPDESGSFYAEATALALAPGISPLVRGKIEARMARKGS